jgi:polar amino acid transport system substrate-binding protein
MTLQIKDVDFGTIIGGVQTGKFDMGMAGMTVTEKRLESVNFTMSYATAIQVAIVKADAGYTAIDDFFNLDDEGNWISVKEGVKIGVQQDTTGDIYASDTVENWGFGDENVIRYKTGADAVMALNSGKVTAVIIDNEPAKSFVAVNEGLVILDGAYADEQYAICIAKENTELLDKVNKALEELIADGTVQDIINKYIPADEK